MQFNQIKLPSAQMVIFPIVKYENEENALYEALEKASTDCRFYGYCIK